MFERGLAYRKGSRSTGARAARPSWPTSRSSAAAAGAAARWSAAATLEQWFLRITAYAEELLDATDAAHRVARARPADAEELDRAIGRRPREVRAAAGRRRHGACRPLPADAPAVEVFTTRIDTIYGATFVVLAPEHEWIERIADESPRPGGASQPGRSGSAPRTAPARLTGEIEKEGVFTGRYAVNPFTGAPCRSGSPTSSSASTAPAPSWPCRRTTSATSSSRGSTACRSRSSSSPRAQAALDGGHDDRGRTWSQDASSDSGPVRRAVVGRGHRARWPRRPRRAASASGPCSSG